MSEAAATPVRKDVAVILAAGKSTRMKSKCPKALHRLCGRRLLDYILDACRGCGIERIVVVVGHQADALREALGDSVLYAEQTQQLGTGHALLQAESVVPADAESLLVLPADTALITACDLRRLLDTHYSEGSDATLLTTVLEDAGHYGRVLRDDSGRVRRIVEAKDCSPAERQVGEINSSIYCFRTDKVFSSLRKVGANNAQGEYYLTDVVQLLAEETGRVGAVVLEDPRNVLGVNQREELAEVEAELRRRKNRQLMLDGVSMTDPAATYVDWDVEVGADTLLLPGVVLQGATRIGEDCVIGPNTRLVDMVVGNGVQISYSVARGSEIADGALVGPFSQIRPGCKIGPRVKVGNFVEVNRSEVEEGAKMSHLTYIGDAQVGARTNVGAGTVICNYDGKRKHKTRIGRGAFLGSHTTLIAPVEVGDGAYIAAASPICQDVPADSLAVARSRQTVKEGWAKRRRERDLKEQEG